MMNMGRLHQISADMSYREGFIKLAITVFFVPVPILAFTGLGVWLDYYKFNTLPLFSALGVVLGTFIAFVGVCQIITIKRRSKNG